MINTPNCSVCGSPKTNTIRSNGKVAVIRCFDSNHKTEVHDIEFAMRTKLNLEILKIGREKRKIRDKIIEYGHSIRQLESDIKILEKEHTKVEKKEKLKEKKRLNIDDVLRKEKLLGQIG